MQKRLTIRWLLRMLACAAVCLCALAFASAREVSPADTLLAQVRLPKVLGDGTFEYGGQRFNRLLIPRYVTEQFEHSAYAVLPGQCDNRVTEVKQFLLSNGDIVPIRQRGVKPVRQAYIDYTASKSAGL